MTPIQLTRAALIKEAAIKNASVWGSLKDSWNEMDPEWQGAAIGAGGGALLGGAGAGLTGRSVAKGALGGAALGGAAGYGAGKLGGKAPETEKIPKKLPDANLTEDTPDKEPAKEPAKVLTNLDKGNPSLPPGEGGTPENPLLENFAPEAKPDKSPEKGGEGSKGDPKPENPGENLTRTRQLLEQFRQRLKLQQTAPATN